MKPLLACLVTALAPVLFGTGCRTRGGGVPETLVLGQVNSAVSLDPYLHDEEFSSSTLSHFYNKLVGFGPEMQVLPELAVRWENPSDTVWRFHLRPGVVFHDGTPFGAADVVASVRRAVSLPETQVGYYLQSVENVRAVDDLTVEIVTDGPSPVLLNKLAFIDIVPETAETMRITRPIGTGPYRFVSGTPGGPVEGERFARFWGTPPAFARVRIVSIPDARARAEAVPNGAAHLVTRYPEEFWAWGQKQPNARMVSRAGLGPTFLGFSLREGSPFADPRLRRAVAFAVDRIRLAKASPSGLAVPIDQIVPNAVFGHSASGRPWPHDPDAARKLIAEAGVEQGADLELLYADLLEPIALELVRQLGEAGLHVRPAPLSWPEFNGRWKKQETPLVLFGWAAGTGDASDIFDAMFHTPGKGWGGWNLLSYSNPMLDDLIELADRTLDPHRRLAHLNAAMEVLRADVPVLPLVLRPNLYATRPDLEWTPRMDRRIRAFDVKPAAVR